MKKVLVTGAAGFLGSFLVEELLARGQKVVGMDNFFRGKKENLPTHENFVFYNVDLVTDYEKLSTIILKERPDTIYHYAAINGTKYFYDIPFKVLDDNVRMTQNLLNATINTTVNKIVYASSSEVYGHNPIIPTPETEFIILNAMATRDSYASSKAIGEFYVMNFCKENNIDFLIIRPFNTYGPRMDNTEYGQVVPEFIKKIKNDKNFVIIGSGEQTRSFCYVEDHCKAVVELSFCTQNEIFNVGEDTEISINFLAKIMHNLMRRDYKPTHTPDRPNDTKRRQPDITKLVKHIPSHKFKTLEQGLSKTIKWYEKNNNTKMEQK